MLSPITFLFASMVVGASGVAREATKEAEFKDHLEWAQENFAATREKIAALQKEEKETSACSSKKCPIKNYQVPAQISIGEHHINQASQEKVLVFVSFSMPEASLKSLMQEAEKANAVLILRGLIEDSFKVTVERLKDCAQGVEVNPDLFEEYNIQHVPTFVKLKGDQEQARLSGNVTLRFAVQKLAEVS